MVVIGVSLYKYRNRPLVNVPDLRGWTPLHFACSDNNKELVELLLKGGGNPNAM